MTFTVRIRRRAEDDIREARDWYDRIQPDLGRDFGDKLDAVIDSLATHPLIHARIYKDIRRAMTRRFPYAVYFVVEDNRVSVLRVLHHARDPREWQRER
jgi:plasmid stabilization system protein ParE